MTSIRLRTTFCNLFYKSLNRQFHENSKYTYVTFSRSFMTGCNDFGSEKPSDNASTDRRKLLESRDINAKHFGSLNINVPFDVTIESLNPLMYPDMNSILMRLFYAPEEHDNNPLDTASLTKLYKLNIIESDNRETFDFNGRSESTELPIICHLNIPLKFDLNVQCSTSKVFIRKMESETIQVKSRSCTLTDIKCGNISVECKDGSITSNKVLQGNAKLCVEGTGNIKTGRLQGTEFQCITDRGDIESTSVYCPKSSFSSNHGDITLSNCHGNSNIQISTGNLKIDSLEGKMVATVQEGSADVYVTRADDININCQSGDIDLKVGETINSVVEMQGKQVSTEDRVNFTQEEESQTDSCRKVTGYINGKGGKISAVASLGHVNLQLQSWINSLKLKL